MTATTQEKRRTDFAATYRSAFCSQTANHRVCKGWWPAYGLTPELTCRCDCHRPAPEVRVPPELESLILLPAKRSPEQPERLRVLSWLLRKASLEVWHARVEFRTAQLAGRDREAEAAIRRQETADELVEWLAGGIRELTR